MEPPVRIPCRCNASGSFNPHLRRNPPSGCHQHRHHHPDSVSGQPEPNFCHGCCVHNTSAIYGSKTGDVRYRSFHNFHQLPQNMFMGKSRASWAVPSRPVPSMFSPGFLAYPSELELGSHSDLTGQQFRRVAPTNSCSCLHSLPFPSPMAESGHYFQPVGHPCLGYTASTYDLTSTDQSGTYWNHHNQVRRSSRKNQACQTIDEAEKAKSLRWTKDQLKKFDNLIVKPTAKTALPRNGSLSSSSGGGLTDDSGVHSRSTTKSSNKEEKVKSESKREDLIGRSGAGRRPIRKLPSPPKKCQTSNDEKKIRALPTRPVVHGKEGETKETMSGRLSNFFRSVKLSPKSKKEASKHVRIFGTDLFDLYNTSQEKVPKMLMACTEFIEKEAMVDGIYRVSGIASNIKKLRALFECGAEASVLKSESWIKQDIHCVASLVKLFFRELPEPLCSRETLPLLKKAAQVGALNSDSRDSLPYFKAALSLLRKPHYWTLKHLLLHLQRVSKRMSETGMSSKNLAIVWTPNLFRTPLFMSHPTLNSSTEECPTSYSAMESLSPKLSSKTDHPRFQFSLGQNTQIVQYLIENAQTIFQCDPGVEDLRISDQYQSLSIDSVSVQKQTALSQRYVTSFAIGEPGPKSLPIHKFITQVGDTCNNKSGTDESKTANGNESKSKSVTVNVSYNHEHQGKLEFSPKDKLVLKQTHHPATHRHIHVQPVFLRTISQV